MVNFEKELLDKIGEYWARAKWDNLGAMDALGLTKATSALGKLLEQARGKKWESDLAPTEATSLKQPQPKELLPSVEPQSSLKPAEAVSVQDNSSSSSTTALRRSTRGRARR